MATSEQVKALLRSHADGDDEQFRAVALQIAAHAARVGNSGVAEDLKRLIDSGFRSGGSTRIPPSVPIARPPTELSGLIEATYPKTRLSDMVVALQVGRSLQEVVHQYRQRDRLRQHGLSPKRKLLLVGPPGCGKTMTASALAGECGLPLMFVQLHALITKYMGETAAKLHSVFQAMAETPGVYLFDEFDAIGATRSARNDVGEIRRALNSFLVLLDRDDSDALIVAATNFEGMLDEALFRRFDDVVRYGRPTGREVRRLVEDRLAPFEASAIRWPEVTRAAAGLCHADIVRACSDAAKAAVLAGHAVVDGRSLSAELRARRLGRPKSGRKGGTRR